MAWGTATPHSVAFLVSPSYSVAFLVAPSYSVAFLVSPSYSLSSLGSGPYSGASLVSLSYLFAFLVSASHSVLAPGWCRTSTSGTLCQPWWKNHNVHLHLLTWCKSGMEQKDWARGCRREVWGHGVGEQQGASSWLK